MHWNFDLLGDTDREQIGTLGYTAKKLYRAGLLGNNTCTGESTLGRPYRAVLRTSPQTKTAETLQRCRIEFSPGTA